MLIVDIMYIEELPAGDDTNYTFLVILALPTTYQLQQVKRMDIMHEYWISSAEEDILDIGYPRPRRISWEVGKFIKLAKLIIDKIKNGRDPRCIKFY